MKIEFTNLPAASFNTTRTADNYCSHLTGKLGWQHRYVAARLAIARSLALSTPPPRLTENERTDMATAIRGRQLFGEGAHLAAWLALIVQRAGQLDMSRRDFHALVSAHWKRGAELLAKDWENSGEDMARFVERLAELANLPDGEPDQPAAGAASPSHPTVAGAVRLPVGEIARDARTREPVEFVMNGTGGSPHMAIMGGVGAGKTRTAIHMLKKLRDFGDAPLLAFDFKGDLAESLAEAYDASVLNPPEAAVPLDVLHVPGTGDNAIKTAAGAIRDSIASVKSSRIGGVQSEALREAIAATLRRHAGNGASTLADVAAALENEYEDRERKPDELTATLNELTQFELFNPVASPAQFFSNSWIIQLPQSATPETRRLIVNLTLDALDRWLNTQPDAPMDAEGHRALRHVTLLDEAHVVLRTKLRALENLVRMSRSKGGAMLLASQSPDDFDGVDDDYLANMGLTLAFATQARPGPTRRIFGPGSSLTGLTTGEALCRIRMEAKTRRIVAWT